MPYGDSGGSGGSGTVTTTSVATANGFAGTVANPTTTPAITIKTSITGILKGNGTAVSTAVYADLPVPTAGSIANSMLANSAVANLSGTNTGDQTSVIGNAGTATVLATPRAINGVNFDGSAAITVTAAAGTLTGTTLNATVVTSSLTSVGTLATLTVTATITGSVSGNAATVTTNANMTGDVTSVGNATTVAKIQTVTVSGVTGTGNVVFSAAPTFTGTVLLNAISASGQLKSASTGAASTPVVYLTALPYSAGSTTTNFPQVFFQSTTPPTAVTTWSAGGTYLGGNLDTGFAGNIIDFRSNGATSASALFQVKASGSIVSAGAGTFNGGGIITATPTTGTSGTWKLGIAVTTSALTPSTTTYIQLDVGGTLYKMATYS